MYLRFSLEKSKSKTWGAVVRKDLGTDKRLDRAD